MNTPRERLAAAIVRLIFIVGILWTFTSDNDVANAILWSSMILGIYAESISATYLRRA
jgi:hypothetical protein